MTLGGDGDGPEPLQRKTTATREPKGLKNDSPKILAPHWSHTKTQRHKEKGRKPLNECPVLRRGGAVGNDWKVVGSRRRLTFVFS